MFKTEFKNGWMLVLGGVRSGKSSLALDMCNKMEEQMNRKCKMSVAALIMVTVFIVFAAVFLVKDTSLQAATDSKSHFRACEHTYNYHLDKSTYVEATEEHGGHRRYVCDVCGASYEYDTAPLVYQKNPKTGKAVDYAGSVNPSLPLWERRLMLWARLPAALWLGAARCGAYAGEGSVGRGKMPRLRR